MWGDQMWGEQKLNVGSERDGKENERGGDGDLANVGALDLSRLFDDDALVVPPALAPWVRSGGGVGRGGIEGRVPVLVALPWRRIAVDDEDLGA